MTKKELIRRICQQTGYGQNMVKEVVNVYTDIIINELQEKRSFRFERLGTLWFIESMRRRGFNPFSRKHEVFDGKNRIKFVPSKGMERLLNPTKEE